MNVSAPFDQKCSCSNCGWEGLTSQLATQLEDCEDLGNRLEPGGEVPAGECPTCEARDWRAFCYLVKDVRA